MLTCLVVEVHKLRVVAKLLELQVRNESCTASGTRVTDLSHGHYWKSQARDNVGITDTGASAMPLQVVCGTMGMPTATVQMRGPDGIVRLGVDTGTGEEVWRCGVRKCGVRKCGCLGCMMVVATAVGGARRHRQAGCGRRMSEFWAVEWLTLCTACC